jgi:hypothetical protein
MARVTITGKSRAAGSDVSLARSVLLRRNPEGEELAILKMKAKADGLVRERRQIVHTIPTNSCKVLSVVTGIQFAALKRGKG